MDIEKPNILVVGSDSLIGRELITYLRQAGDSVIGTTRRQASISQNNLFLDLSDGFRQWQCPPGIKVAVILAGITDIAECQNNPAWTKKINQERIIDLISLLVSQGVYVIYISTSAVFDGTKPFRKPLDFTSPTTEYGKQKVVVETAIQQWKDSVAILRVTKIYGDPKEVFLFRDWIKHLREGRCIYPFSNMTVAPISSAGIVSVLRILIDRKLPGIFHLSGNRDISYEEVAYLGADLLKLDKKLIQPIPAEQAERYIGVVLKYSSLDMDTLREVIGLNPPDVEWVITNVFSQIQKTLL